MIPFKRHEYILSRLKTDSLYIADLAKEMEVAEITVRRDLKQMQEKGLIELQYGGLATVIDTTKETPMGNRTIRFMEEKRAIAKRAVSFIEEGDVVFIDSGTTTQLMFDCLPQGSVRIFTNGILNMNKAVERHTDISVIGGDLKRETMALVGPAAIESLSRLSFDKVFLGTNGIDRAFGLSNADQNESFLKRLSIQNSRQAFVLADSSKFDQRSAFQFAGLSDVTIVTDHVPEPYRGISPVLEAPVPER